MTMEFSDGESLVGSPSRESFSSALHSEEAATAPISTADRGATPPSDAQLQLLPQPLVRKPSYASVALESDTDGSVTDSSVNALTEPGAGRRVQSLLKVGGSLQTPLRHHHQAHEPTNPLPAVTPPHRLQPKRKSHRTEQKHGFLPRLSFIGGFILLTSSVIGCFLGRYHPNRPHLLYQYIHL